jgi:hypothetical protein
MTPKKTIERKEIPTSNEKPKNLRAQILPTEGFAVAVDAKIKSYHATAEEGFAAGLKIKQSFPVVHVAIFDAKEGTRTPIELPAAEKTEG